MREPSEDAVLKRAKELWKEAGYTDGAEARSVSCLGTRLPRARVLMTPTRLKSSSNKPVTSFGKRDRLCLKVGAGRSAPLMWSEFPSRSCAS